MNWRKSTVRTSLGSGVVYKSDVHGVFIEDKGRRTGLLRQRGDDAPDRFVLFLPGKLGQAFQTLTEAKAAAEGRKNNPRAKLKSGDYVRVVVSLPRSSLPTEGWVDWVTADGRVRVVGPDAPGKETATIVNTQDVVKARAPKGVRKPEESFWGAEYGRQNPRKRKSSEPRSSARGIATKRGLSQPKLGKMKKAPKKNSGMKEVSKSQFFKAIGPLNVHPRQVGAYPYTAIFETPDRVEHGRIVSTETQPGTVVARYFLTHRSNPRYASGPYTERVKLPKWSGTPGLVEAPAPRIRASFPGMTPADHERAIEKAIVHANAAARAYNRTMRGAYQKYGEKGPLISGIGQDHFPEGVKNLLRKQIKAFNAAQDAVALHYKALGKRTPLYQSAYVDRMVKAGGYGLGRHA